MKSEQEWEIDLQGILENLRNNSISEVDLKHRRLDANGAKVLVKVLKINHSLRAMNLDYNNIGDEGVVALAEALKVNHSLTIMRLWKNNIGAKGIAALAEALKGNHSLESIYLAENNIGVESVSILVDVLEVNHSLTDMDWWNWNDVTHTKQQEIVKYLDRNIALRNQLHESVQTGHLKGTENCIQRGVGLLSVTGRENNTPLHWAAAKGHGEIVKLLLAKMAEQNLNLAVKNKFGRTSLDLALAMKTGCEEAIRLLQEAKEKVSQDNNNISQSAAIEKSAKDYLQDGDRFFMNESYAESLQCYESILKLQPEHLEALVRKGKALQKLNQLEEAKQAYQQLIATEDKNAEKYHQQAKKRLEKINKKQVLLQQSMPIIVSAQIESTEREELLGRVGSSAETRKPNIQSNSATKQTKTTNSSAAIPLSQNSARVQFNLKSTLLQTNASRSNGINSKEESSGIAEEKKSTQVLK